MRVLSGIALVLATSLVAPVAGSPGATAAKHHHKHVAKAHHEHPNKTHHKEGREHHPATHHHQHEPKSEHGHHPAGHPHQHEAKSEHHAVVAAGHHHIAKKSTNYKDMVGLSWTNAWLSQKAFAPHAKWCYNWGCSGTCAQKGSGLTYAPQFWNRKDIANWKKNVMGKPWEAILGHNEPNIAGQGNTSPGEAASEWREYIQPVNSQIKCSPAVTTGSEGLNWLKQWVNDCKGCDWTHLTIHHYDITAASFIKQANLFHQAFPQATFWVTEIGCQSYSGGGACSQSMALAMLREIKQFIIDTPWIEVWFWYQMAQSTNIDNSNLLINGRGEPTEMANIFMGVAQ